MELTDQTHVFRASRQLADVEETLAKLMKAEGNPDVLIQLNRAHKKISEGRQNLLEAFDIDRKHKINKIQNKKHEKAN